MYSITFRLRTEPLKTEKRKIYVRLKINGVAATDFATSIVINPDQWVNKTIKGNTELDYTNRAMLLKVESDLIELIRTNPTKSAKEIRNMYVGKTLAPATILTSYQKYITDKKECWKGTEHELEKHTIQRWYNCMQHLSEFLNGKDIELSSIDIDFGNRLYLYLIKKEQKKKVGQKIGHDYAVRNLTYLNQVIDYAKRKGLIAVNVLDIADYKRNPPKPIEHLTESQLSKLASFKFTGVLEDARIVFLAMAYSGINHCDLNQLHSLKGKDALVLNVGRQKNDGKFIDKAIVPIFPELRALLERFDYNLPLHGISVINRHLHTFEGLLGVDINITTYTARKTAAMLLSQRGVSIDVVSKILGHTSIITTQRYYVKVAEQRVLDETKHLR